MLHKTPNLDNLLGRPWGKGGKQPDSFNCWELCVEVCKRVGIVLPDVPYEEDPSNRAIVIANKAVECFEKLERSEPYCLVTFRMYGQLVGHMGVVWHDCRNFVHVMEKQRVCFEKLNHPFWKCKINGFYRLQKEK